jgi:thiamine kinase-like enzyme
MPNPTHLSSFDLEKIGKELEKISEQIIYQYQKKKNVLEKIYNDIIHNVKIREHVEKLKDLTFGEGEGSKKMTQKFAEFDRKTKTEKKRIKRSAEEKTLVYEKFPFK